MTKAEAKRRVAGYGSQTRTPTGPEPRFTAAWYAAGAAGELELHCFELQDAQTFWRHARAEAQNLNADDSAFSIVVEHHSGLNLLGFDDCRLVKPQI